MKFVKPKKSLGQHFLKDNNIANKIVDSLDAKSENVLEIGPGMGILTKFLLKKKYNLRLVEIDTESVSFLMIMIKHLWRFLVFSMVMIKIRQNF